ncbi:MAG: menaquinone biosynthesis protein [Caldimicrobium sp.]|nr:menaquinone biosynthesis protein [Caldimicrobium sp.]MCX7613431.1 menaquinone biosynthesis protein [Caldimicrobium sp.]MDW8183026.1 menaquinone biosynthesis protein [Caldimicrobium sp.]
MQKTKDKEHHKISIGFPKYLNTLPLLYYLKTTSIDLKLQTPKKINRDLKLGTLTGGLASSLFYARNYRSFLIVPDLSISAVGKVKSVILFHNGFLQTLHNKRIGITPETETSFALLRIILEEFYKVSPEYVALDQNWSDLPDEEKINLQGYLAIGDEALILQREKPFKNTTDLAELWLEKTRLPFVFALFVLRKDFLKSREICDRLRDFILELYKARAKGVSTLKKIIKDSHLAIQSKGVLSYLQHLEYDFSGLKQKAFLEFCGLLQRRGLLPRIPNLLFFDL